MAGAQSASPATLDAADPMARRMRACSACHGAEGQATAAGYFPRIAGKPAGYLYNQLVNFQEGRRNNAAMAYLVQHMSAEYLRQIAQYFAALDPPYAAPPRATAGAELARGESLVRQGDAARGIPSCASCHGVAMSGVEPAIPGLLGLPRDYLVAQLGAWRGQRRRAAEPDCMARVAGALSDADIAAVAGWLATQPVPQAARPAASVPLPLPFECGSGLK